MGVKCLHTIILFCFTLFLGSCKEKRQKSDLEITFSQDTLHLGYTYWWDESGPFIGYCGTPHTLIAMGSIVQMDAPNDDAGPLYTSQKGSIQLEKVFLINNPKKNAYHQHGYLNTDCFYKSGLKIGDKVLVFCYEYDDELIIPGQESIIPIGDWNHPLVNSTKTFIDKDENPLKIEKDTTLWEAYGHGTSLKRIIECRETTSK
ncbi:hypothetical protein [Euzebyella saccharophila]|uniref:Uncharacterized protein n=1 Tax=Euzebyella saccharophila TaxID=679664 RepID=A0ABV8JPX4_9FLAO|nr:hypothetical protein [Euzebyella saccharophila]